MGKIFRRQVYAQAPVNLFKIKIDNANDTLLIFGKNTRKFKTIDSNIRFISPATEGIFKVRKSEDGCDIISY